MTVGVGERARVAPRLLSGLRDGFGACLPSPAPYNTNEVCRSAIGRLTMTGENWLTGENCMGGRPPGAVRMGAAVILTRQGTGLIAAGAATRSASSCDDVVDAEET